MFEAAFARVKTWVVVFLPLCPCVEQSLCAVFRSVSFKLMLDAQIYLIDFAFCRKSRSSDKQPALLS